MALMFAGMFSRLLLGRLLSSVLGEAGPTLGLTTFCRFNVHRHRTEEWEFRERAW